MSLVTTQYKFIPEVNVHIRHQNIHFRHQNKYNKKCRRTISAPKFFITNIFGAEIEIRIFPDISGAEKYWLRKILVSKNFGAEKFGAEIV